MKIGNWKIKKLEIRGPVDSAGREGGEAGNQAVSSLDLCALQFTVGIKDSGVKRPG